MESNCSKAIHQHGHVSRYIANVLRHPRYGLTLPGVNQSSIMLKSINAGSGTTGTRSINALICSELGVTAMHFLDGCNIEGGQTAMQEWTLAIGICIADPSIKCRSADLLDSYRHALTNLLLNYEFASDFPIDSLLPDILHFAPDQAVILSLRDPVEWAERRLSLHPFSAICHPKLWKNANVLHPYDFISCMQSEKIVSDALVQTRVLDRMFGKSKALVELQQAFVSLNTVTMSLIKAAGVPSLQICLWDDNISDNNDIVAVVRRFWKSHNTTAAIAGREGRGKGPKPVFDIAKLRDILHNKYALKGRALQPSSRRLLYRGGRTGGELPQFPRVRNLIGVAHDGLASPFSNVQYCVLLFLFLFIFKLSLFLVHKKMYRG